MSHTIPIDWHAYAKPGLRLMKHEMHSLNNAMTSLQAL